MYNLIQAEQICPLCSRDLYLCSRIELVLLAQLWELSYRDHNPQKQTVCVIGLCKENVSRAHSQMLIWLQVQRSCRLFGHLEAK